MMFLAWIGVNLADAVLTAFSLNLGGAEVNPFLGTLALPLGLQRMLLVKVLFAVAMGGVLWQRNAFHTMRLLNYSMAAIVMFNALVFTYAL